MRDAMIEMLGRSLSTGDRPDGPLQLLQTETVVAADLEETFRFFADAWNLERLTPPWLEFRILTPRPMVMREGAILDYRIRLRGVSIPWRTRIDVWEPGLRFVDRQMRGPYRWWHHEHRFEATPGGTRVIDRVEFVPRLRWLTAGLVERDVARIFAYRREALTEIFATAINSAGLGPGGRPWCRSARGSS